MTKPKAHIEVLPVDEADWLSDENKLPGLNWAYRVISPFNPENEITGARAGTKTTVTLHAKEIGKKIVMHGKGQHPFARPIKNNYGVFQKTDFNRYPGE